MSFKPGMEKQMGYHGLSDSDQKQIKKAIQHGITRREALSWLASAGLSLAAANSIFWTASKAIAAVPKKGGRIRCAMSAHSPGDTFDPQLFTSSIDFTRGRAHYNSLIQLKDDIVPRPELAEEFSPDANATEWTFKLRKNVTFHDGSKMTADDVIWSMNRHTGENSKSKVKSLLSMVKEWKKIDSYTVKAILDSPNSDLATLIGTHHFKILKQGTENFQNPVGTGPFKLKEFKPGIRSVHVRNPDYWRDGPNLDELEIFAITESTARVNALLAGDVHLISNLDPKAIGIVESAGNVGVWSVPSGSYPAIVCMTNTSPGENRDFVLGMKFLQRRERILKSVLKGQGTIGNDQPINTAYADHCRSLKQRPYDPDRAKFHLKKSGISSAEIQVAEISNGITDTVLILQRECANVGFDLKIKKVPNDGYWGAVWMKTPMHVSDWNMRPTANIMLNIAFAPDAKWNDSQWKNERMGKLLQAAWSETDAAKRAQLHCEMQTLVSEESGVIIPVHKNSVDGISDNVKGMTRSPLGTLGGSEWPEFIWLDS
ncbi:MAG: ABC transporter substrate-binding protein [Desulfotignum sp.]|nr:ABC transporter substrate-binding protein [Desulfotignum sp.]